MAIDKLSYEEYILQRHKIVVECRLVLHYYSSQKITKQKKEKAKKYGNSTEVSGNKQKRHQRRTRPSFHSGKTDKAR